ncbi:MAG TPA: NUDIX domain-containing protein, partial [Chthoniobacterales bacterium]|nr:NUDIX domain-containing protein [Chthoniobacterales bacterium]
RSQVHANNLLHRAVHILIFNPSGEVFLQLRSRTKDRHPLKWDSSAAGHVNAGESYEKAADRELFEELGIRTPLQQVAKLAASDKTDQEFIRVYQGRYDSSMNLNSCEIESGNYFSPQLVDRWIKARPNEFAPGFVECWRVWRQQNPNVASGAGSSPALRRAWVRDPSQSA